MKRIFFIFAGLLLWLQAVLPQNVEMPDVVNHYLQVQTVFTDRVLVANANPEISYFHPGDKVLLIQMTGTTLPKYPGYLTDPAINFPDDWRNAGAYEILQVDQVITGANNYIVFTDDHLYAYDAGEKIQLVRLVEGDNVTVTANVSAKPWDGYTGGIIAIIGMDSVKLNANLDVSGSGFRGATVPVENYTAACRMDVSSSIVDTLYFDKYHLNRSGNKGEGIITVDTLVWPYTKGAGSGVNGGGAGNGLFSGGGGGGNYRKGGTGGGQSSACTGNILVSAWGGYACYSLYKDYGRVIMGGGGGTGVKNIPSLKVATNGGNGGGIIFIITGTLVGNGKELSANGQDINTAATGSGGGGGAAGSILMDVTGYSGDFKVNIKGGKGGAGNATTCTGSGGGGSGGVLWHSGAAITGATALVDSAGGKGGTAGSCFSNYGANAENGVKLKDLLLNLTGFLFNSIRGTDTICAGQIPNKITASRPKGGNGLYVRQWQQSTDDINWAPATGTVYGDSLRPPALTQTTFYRRIVTSHDKNNSLITDISRSVKIYVYPAISNNIVSGTDTICYDLPAKTLAGTAPAGGNSIYQYLWQSSTDQSVWNNGGNLDSYNPGPLQQTTYFRRQVTSTAYCANTSNSVKVTVLPSISNNVFFSADTVICKDLGPGLLNALPPAEGDGTYTYLWQSRPASGSWASVPSSNVPRYDPGILTDTYLYRRIVYSGNGQACIDTSATKTINVLPLISGNIITSDSDRYCSGDVPMKLTGSQPAGGNLVYSYEWLVKESGNWSTIAGATLKDYVPDQAVDENVNFKRVITSGDYNACVDTSAVFVLDVIPAIQNSITLEDQVICEDNIPLALNGSAATGGLGGFTYLWLEKTNSAWSPATGTNDQVSFIPGALFTTTMYSRIAKSDICPDTTSALTVTVYPSITNNNITGGTIQYTCFNLPGTLAGSQPANGNGSYSYEWQQSTNNTDWTTAEGIARDFTTSPLVAPAYFRRVVFSSPALRECADTSASVEVQINPLPTGDLIGSTDTICAGEPLTVRFNTSGVHPPFSVTIGSALAERNRPGITASPDTIQFYPSSTQSYSMLQIVDDSGCVADSSLFTVEAEAVVYEVPVANAGNDDEVCSDTYALQAVKSIPDSKGFWSAGDAVFIDPADPATETTVDQYGARQFTWTEYNWQCSDDDQVQIIFNEQPAAAEAGPDQALDFSYTTQLEAVTPLAGSGKWTVVSGAGKFNNDTLPDAVVVELDNSTTLKWTVRNGNCPEVSDQMDILISPLEITKGFSPNGDTKNDVFDLGAVNAERIRLKVYNSTGVLVFESDDYVEGVPWDGKNKNGVELPEGTYFYIADIKVAGREKEFQFRSFVEILR